MTGKNLNKATYQGGRVSLAYKFTDDWDLLLQQNFQNLEADGYFSSEPIGPNGQALAPYQTMSFAPAWNKDKYNSTAWTFNGRFPALFGSGGDLKTIYTGSYLNRSVDQQNDYSNYLTSHHGSYYACSGSGAGYAYFRSSQADHLLPGGGHLARSGGHHPSKSRTPGDHLG